MIDIDIDIDTSRADLLVQFPERIGTAATSVLHLAQLMLQPKSYAYLQRELDSVDYLSPDAVNRSIIHVLTLGFTCMLRLQKGWGPLDIGDFTRLEEFAHAVGRVYPLILVAEGWGSSGDFSIDLHDGGSDFVATIAGYSLETDEATIDPFSPQFSEDGLTRLEAYLHRHTGFDDPRGRVRSLMRALPHMPDPEEDEEDDGGARHRAYESRFAQILGLNHSSDDFRAQFWRNKLATDAASA